MRLDHLLSREPVYLISLLGWGVVVSFVPMCGARDARRYVWKHWSSLMSRKLWLVSTAHFGGCGTLVVVGVVLGVHVVGF